MFGLFKVTFDYYKWEDLVCVSAVKCTLERFHKDNVNDHPLLSEEESKEISDRREEKFHYVILEVKEI
ncbi:MAG: hypothetical protein GY954_05140 [Alteromonas sp.]|nr:hypothetical protein [Alteromonas sp.]